MYLMHCGETGIEFPAVTTDPTVPVRTRTHGPAASLQVALAAGQFLTLPQLFETRNDPKAKHELSREVHLSTGYWGWVWVKYGTFDDEAYEFARFCLFGADGRHRDAFRRFAEAASNGPLDEAGFQRFFGEDYQAMLRELWGYTDFARTRTTPFSSMGLAIRLPARPAAFRPVTAAQIAQMKAAWLQHPSGP